MSESTIPPNGPRWQVTVRVEKRRFLIGQRYMLQSKSKKPSELNFCVNSR
jgi:hypothetical protein